MNSYYYIRLLFSVPFPAYNDIPSTVPGSHERALNSVMFISGRTKFT